MGSVERSSGIQSPRVDLGTLVSFLEFFQDAFEFAIFPNARRRPDAEAIGRKTQPDSWMWIASLVRDCLKGPSREDAGLIGNLSRAYLKAFYRAGKCECTLYGNPKLARDMFHLWHLVCLRRMEFIRWKLAPAPLPSNNRDPNLRVFWFVVARNVDSVCRRWTRASASPLSKSRLRFSTHDG